LWKIPWIHKKNLRLNQLPFFCWYITKNPTIWCTSFESKS
jgi:hypothetical protein